MIVRIFVIITLSASVSFAQNPFQALLAKISEKQHAAKSSRVQSHLKHLKYYFSGRYQPVQPPLTEVDFDPSEAICDPLSNSPSENPENGLLGQLILRSPEMSEKTSSVMEYYDKGLKLDKKLYFADVNVPTRHFTDGFTTVDGQTLVDENNERLIEHFSVVYDSVLKLSDGDEEGHYELALLSDDGARLFAFLEGRWTEIVNNDGNHATRMGCAYQTVHLTKASEIPIKILYYQGSRYHLSNVLIWKLHNKARTWSNPNRHSFCGISSNSFFFGLNQNKKARTVGAINALERSGWSVVKNANFRMPENTRNPCTVEELVISDAKIAAIDDTTATLTWKTNIPATSQVRVVDSDSGEDTLSVKSTEKVTEHSVVIEGLRRGMYYMVQGLSEDAQGKVVRSPMVDLLMPYP